MVKSIKAACASFLTFLLLGTAGCGTGQQTATSQPEEPLPLAQQPGPQGYVVQDIPGEAVRGRVLLNGQPPAPVVSRPWATGTCGTEIVTYPVRVEKGGIVDAVVWIDGIGQGKPFDLPEPVLDQQKCVFVPRVLVMQPGELTVRTQDPTPHDVHTFAEANRNFNLSMNQVVNSVALSLRRPEWLRIGCDLHGWMKAYVIVAAHPYYAVTRDGGTFQLERVPAGRYRLKVWQETLGEMEKEIVVESGKATTVEFVMQSK